MLTTDAATARLGREILVSERSLAAALVDTTALLHSCALAAHDNPTASPHAHSVFLRTHKATANLIEARGELSRTHGALLEVYREVAGTMEPYPCPDAGFTTASNEADKIPA